VLAPRYYRHSHLPGALNLPPGKVAEMAADLLRDKEAEIVLYCWDEA
jgi:rhodanese-related sulfurtransferase